MNPSDIIKQRTSRINYINYKIQRSDFLNGDNNVVRPTAGTGSSRSISEMFSTNIGAPVTNIDVLNEGLDSTPSSILRGGSFLSTASRESRIARVTNVPKPEPEVEPEPEVAPAPELAPAPESETSPEPTPEPEPIPEPSPELTGSLDPVITDGLQIYLNANEPASYSSMDTIWTNLYSEGSYNAQLVSAPIYDHVAKGITFNGTNQYAEIADAIALRATPAQSITVQIWAKVPVALEPTAKGLVSKQYGSPSYDGYSLDFDATNKVRLRMNGRNINIIQGATTNNSYTPDSWQLFTMVVDFNGSETLIYVNNSQVLTNTNGETSIPSNTAPIRIASGIQEGNNLLACTVGAVYYYNRALTPSEIVENFDATKTYYGVQ